MTASRLGELESSRIFDFALTTSIAPYRILITVHIEQGDGNAQTR